MQNRKEVFSEEEEAFLRLTDDDEKKYFKKILRIEKEHDGYITKKRPKLSINYYIYRYKNEGVSFNCYLSDTENELMLMKAEIAVSDSTDSGRKYGLRAMNKYLAEETQKERKLARKRNARFAVLILAIVFIFLILMFLK